MLGSLEYKTMTDNDCSYLLNPQDLSLGAFLQRYPALSDLLFEDCDRNLDMMKTILEPLHQVESRCQLTPHYIQAITTGQTTFLITNLYAEQAEPRVSAAAANWLVGRSSSCAISVPHGAVSRCHAIIGHVQGEAFYIMDMGSSNGTRLNRRRLPRLERRRIKDGDLIEFGPIKAEFFITQPQIAKEQSDVSKHRSVITCC